MLIRVRHYRDGVKAYLESGQKQDRDRSRDELDERIILAGDLSLTDALIRSMDTSEGASKYMSFTLSFKEDMVPRSMLADITRDFEAFLFSAYQANEYNFYAEAHVPRIKSYVDRATGHPVERKIHIHIVVPDVNLLTGQRLHPLGKVTQQTRFLQAFQEHTNAKYGLASPREHRRVALTDASQMLSRYKGDVFEGPSRKLKASILAAMLERDIARYDDFRALLAQFGEVRAHTLEFGSEYETVRPAGAHRSVHLKEFVFSREFVELSAQDKYAAMREGEPTQYRMPRGPYATPVSFLQALDDWHTIRAREVKYLNSGSPIYNQYRRAPLEQQRKMLAEREWQFYQPFGGLRGRTINDLRGRFCTPVDGKRPERIRGRGRSDLHIVARPDPAGWGEQQRGRDQPPWGSGAYADPNRPVTSPQSADRMRGLPFGGVDGDPARAQVLLSPDPLLELGVEQAERTHALRRARDLVGADGRRIGAAAPTWRTAVARLYDAYQVAGPVERAQLHAAAATKFTRYRSAPPLGDSISSVPFGAAIRPRNLFDIRSLDAVPSMPFDQRASEVRNNAINRQERGQPTSPVRARPPASIPWGESHVEQHFNCYAHPQTGRQADTMLDQLARDLVDKRARSTATERGELQLIQADVDAQRLLAVLSRTHGLIVEKYHVTKASNDSDRIRVGARELDVSDFLTKELNLSWSDATYLMRAAHQAQTGRSASPLLHSVESTPPPRSPFAFEWPNSAICSKQLCTERERQEEVREQYRAARRAIVAAPFLTPDQVRVALSAARIQRVEQEIALLRANRRERKWLWASRAGQEHQYLASSIALRERGDGSAAQIRQFSSPSAQLEGDPANAARAVGCAKPMQVFDQALQIARVTLPNGHMEYLRSGEPLLLDQGDSIRLWQSDPGAIEIALRLAHQKFGQILELTGPAEFLRSSARVAARIDLNLEFSSPEIQSLFLKQKCVLSESRDDCRSSENRHTTSNPGSLTGCDATAPAPSREGIELDGSAQRLER